MAIIVIETIAGRKYIERTKAVNRLCFFSAIPANKANITCKGTIHTV